jgi:hypothetical protein
MAAGVTARIGEMAVKMLELDLAMDMAAQDQRLARVEKDIRHAQARIARQVAWIEERRRDGRDTTIAEEVLTTLKSCLALHEQYRATLQRKLAEDPRVAEMLDSSRMAIARSLQLLNGDLQSSSGEGQVIGDPIIDDPTGRARRSPRDETPASVRPP